MNAVFDMFDGIDNYTLAALNDCIEAAQMVEGDLLTLNVASYGGEVFMALAVIDLIRFKGLKTQCNVLGLAASAAALIVLSCDHITMTPNSSLMLHSAWREDGEVDDGIRRCNQVQLDIIHNRCPDMDGDKILSQDNWFSAEDCLTLGLCDEISIATYEDAVARYCASIRHKEEADMPSIDDVIEEVKEDKENDQKPEEISEAPSQEQSSQEEPKAEESDASATDVLEMLSQQIQDILRRLDALEAQGVSPSAECGNDDRERLNAIMRSLTPQPVASIGAVASETVKPKVYKANKALLSAYME